MTDPATSLPRATALSCAIQPLRTLLDSITAVTHRFVELPNHYADAMALWIAHTHVYREFDFTPRLLLTSAVTRCGKSTALSLVRALSRDAIACSSATPAVLFRVVHKKHPTLLLDEADGWLDGDKAIRTIVNAGFHQGSAMILRTNGETREPEEFDCFGPMTIAMIGRPAATILDRSIVIQLHRAPIGSKVERLRTRALADIADPIRLALATWSEEAGTEFSRRTVKVPPELDGRAADLWEPLLALGQAASPTWSERATSAAVTICKDRSHQNDDLGLRVLRDLRDIVNANSGTRFASASLVSSLLACEVSGWDHWHRGRVLSMRGLAELLAPFGLRPMTLRVSGGTTAKGYKREDLERLFHGYLDPLETNDAEKLERKEVSK